jgi:hypothetical protein
MQTPYEYRNSSSDGLEQFIWYSLQLSEKTLPKSKKKADLIER